MGNPRQWTPRIKQNARGNGAAGVPRFLAFI
jgi:hypothetical protein